MVETLAGMLQTSAPLILAALAGVFAARTKIWHLGLGGLMAIGAMVSVVTASWSGNIWVAGAAAVAAAGIIAALMWFAIQILRAHPIVVGLGVNAIGLGGTVLGVVALYGSQQTVYSEVGLAKAFPGAEGALGQLSVVAVLVPLVVFASWWILRRTRFGLRVVAVGSHAFAARSAGISASRVRLAVLLIGGALCALAGMELALGSLRSFGEGMEAGRGFIAFAAVILGASQPVRSSLAALAFGAISYLGVWAQVNMAGVFPVEFMLMLPYIAAIIGVVLTASRRGVSASFSISEDRDS